MMTVSINRKPITYKTFKFSGGEVFVKLETSPIYQSEDLLKVRADLFSSDDIMELFMLTDALNRHFGDLEKRLIIPYLPYARQDRVMTSGESLSVKVMCNLINSLGYDSVEVWDAHSDVSLALLNHVYNMSQVEFLYLVSKQNTVLVSPDAGAVKKTSAVAKAYGLPMVTASKIRDVSTGEITGTEVHSEHIGDRDFLIIDDICDGGATYVGYTKSDGTVVSGLVQALRPLTNGKIKLYVTHGIFSKGLKVFDGLVDHIYTANPFPNVDLNYPNLTVLNTKVYLTI